MGTHHRSEVGTLIEEVEEHIGNKKAKSIKPPRSNWLISTAY